MKKVMLIALVVLAFQQDAFARPRYYKTNNNYTYSTPSSSTKNYSYTSATTATDGSDQDRCQAEANHMAANNITGHVWGCIGSFEGVGYGSSPNCNTCTPSGNMRLTGDASAQGRNGMWYRVRSWR
jgi:hypothetical protein